MQVTFDTDRPACDACADACAKSLNPCLQFVGADDLVQLRLQQRRKVLRTSHRVTAAAILLLRLTAILLLLAVWLLLLAVWLMLLTAILLRRASILLLLAVGRRRAVRRGLAVLRRRLPEGALRAVVHLRKLRLVLHLRVAVLDRWIAALRGTPLLLRRARVSATLRLLLAATTTSAADFGCQAPAVQRQHLSITIQ